MEAIYIDNKIGNEVCKAIFCNGKNLPNLEKLKLDGLHIRNYHRL